MSEPMIHVLVYRNTPGKGYDVTNYTGNFPEEYLPYIDNVTYTVGKINGAPHKMLRYAPLEKGFFLLSIMGPEPVGTRNTWQMVHFLMNTEAASDFFLQPFQEAENAMYTLANEILAIQAGIPITMHPEALRPRNIILEPTGACDPKLFEAAIEKKNAVLSYREGTPEAFLETQLSFIPPDLRYKLNFMIGAPADLTDKDIRIHIRKDASPTPPRSSYDHLLRIPAEIPLYRHLQFCILNWNMFQELGLLVKKGNATLGNVLKKLPDKEIVDYIQNPVLPLSREELRVLRNATKPRLPFLSSPVYDAAVAALSELPKEPNSPQQPLIQSQQSNQPDQLEQFNQTEQFNQAAQLGQRQEPANTPRYEPEQAAPAGPRRKTDLSLLLFLLLTAVCFMSTVLLLVGADSKWSLLSLPTGLGAGYYLSRLWNRRKRR